MYPSVMQHMLESIKTHQEEIFHWMSSLEKSNELPLYSSVDIRDGGFKVAVVDSNLFPSGFNNLCEHGLQEAQGFFHDAIQQRVKDCRDILIVTEEHTRNTWYLENVRILEETIKQAGFHAMTATFLFIQPEFCEQEKLFFVNFPTATGRTVRVYCFKTILNEIQQGRRNFDLIILNNDLSTGIPPILTQAHIPIYPSIQAGWHSRLKSHHFKHTADLIRDLSKILNTDPWFFSCLDTVVDKVNINNEADREQMADEAADLFRKIEAKYKEHQIQEKPFMFVKADAGTYGMGVLSVEGPEELRYLNRKKRNKLFKGKSGQIIGRYLLQEGIPTIHSIDRKVSEVVLYQIENHFIGGFYRSHGEKSTRDNLNARGMDFKTMCPHSDRYGDCGIHPGNNVFDLYHLLARIAGIAAHREILHLEAAGR